MRERQERERREAEEQQRIAAERERLERVAEAAERARVAKATAKVIPAVTVTFHKGKGKRLRPENGTYFLVSLDKRCSEWTDIYVKLNKKREPQYWLQYNPKNLRAFAKVARFPLSLRTQQPFTDKALENLRRVFKREEMGQESGVVAKWQHGSLPWFVDPVRYEKFETESGSTCEITPV